MTNKLTKNDSMCDSVQYFDTIAAAFEAFHQPKGLASVTVTLEESDVLSCNYTIKFNQR